MRATAKLRDRIADLFLLRPTAERARLFDEAERARLRRDLLLGRQRAAAADELASRGQIAEALRLAAEALDTTFEAAHRVAEALGMRDADSLLRARGMRLRRLRSVVAARDALRATPAPALDDDVLDIHAALLHRALLARGQVARALGALAMTPRERAWRRALRIAAGTALLGVAGLALFIAVRAPDGVHARSTAPHAPGFGPENVVDGDGSTEFFWPDRAAGVVEVTLSPPRTIETLRLLNAHNRHYNDRATREYTVQLFVAGEVARTIEGSWDEFRLRPEWTEHAVDLERVDRIRFEARSWHRLGAGITEIAWTE